MNFARFVFVLLLATSTACSGPDNNDAPDGSTADVAQSTPDMGGDEADAESDDTGDSGGEPDDGGTDPVVLPTWDELDDGWNELWPGGETSCARGQDYSFYVYKGDPTKLTIHYFGGGACWNRATCQTGDVFNDDLTSLRDRIDAGERPGIFDMENADNPVAGWTQIVLPYCTGDIHWGNNVKDYGNGVVVHHKGGVNGRVALEWAAENVEAPAKVFTQGCSAGSYGAVMWSPHFMQQYPDASHYMLADSGAGVITETFFLDSFPNWQADGVFPTWIPDLDPNSNEITDMTIADLYTGIGAFYPDALLTQWNTRFDETQTLFYSLMGGQGDQEAWSQRMFALTSAISDRNENYRNWVADGQQHCVLPHARFYTHETNGVRLVDWIDDMVNEQPLSDVSCVDCE